MPEETPRAAAPLGPTPRRVGVGALERHIEELCAQHGIEWQLGGRARAQVQGRAEQRKLVIRTPAIRGQVSYFVALHEIGHLVGPGRSGTRLEKEAAAWRWALAGARAQPTEATRRRIGRRLRSYLDWAERAQRRRRPPLLPAPASEFWTLLHSLEA